MHEDELNKPKNMKRGKSKSNLIFVCSMADLFHKDVPFEFIDKVMDVIKSTPENTYQILTKRAEIMAEYFKTRSIPENV